MPDYTVEHNGIEYTVSLYANEDLPDHKGRMIFSHRRYTLGDAHDYRNQREAQASDEFNNVVVCIPVYGYDHGVFRISTTSFIGRAIHAEWDSGVLGEYWFTADEVEALGGVEKTISYAAEIIEKYDSAINNELFDVLLFDPITAEEYFIGTEIIKEDLESWAQRNIGSLIAAARET